MDQDQLRDLAQTCIELAHGGPTAQWIDDLIALLAALKAEVQRLEAENT